MGAGANADGASARVRAAAQAPVVVPGATAAEGSEQAGLEVWSMQCGGDCQTEVRRRRAKKKHIAYVTEASSWVVSDRPTRDGDP